MTEAEWAACDDPRELLDYHRMKHDPRRLRLLAVACARLIPASVACAREAPPAAAVAPPLGPVFDVVERYADGAATRAEFLAARKLARAAGRHPAADPLATKVYVWLADDAMEALTTAIATTRSLTGHSGMAAECNLTRCAFPLRSIPFDPAWRTETVVALAAGVVADRAFDRLPALADALEAAGCADPDVLAHCRGPGPHARCCWVLDGLLGKSAQSGT